MYRTSPTQLQGTESPYIGEGTATSASKRQLFLRYLWLSVQATLFRWSPRPCHLVRALLLKYFGADIPEPRKVVIFPTAKITYPWLLRLEPHSMIGPQVTLYNLDKITLCYGANISQGSHLCAGSHDFNRWSMPLVTAPIVIGPNAWLAAEVFVGPGVTIGELCVVGARSVVVRDLPTSTICVGHPCQPVKARLTPTP